MFFILEISLDFKEIFHKSIKQIFPIPFSGKICMQSKKKANKIVKSFVPFTESANRVI